MDEAENAIVTGTVVHLESCVVVVPTVPPAPSRLPTSEQFRQRFLAANPGWSSDDAGSADTVRRENLLKALRSGSGSVVELHGPDLPADSVRAKLYGELVGRSLRVSSWRPEPCSTSVWAASQVTGTDHQTAAAIVATVPEDWPLVSVGISITTTGARAVAIEVDRLTPEVQTWFDSQAAGSVQLETFVDLAPAGTAPVGRPR